MLIIFSQGRVKSTSWLLYMFAMMGRVIVVLSWAQRVCELVGHCDFEGELMGMRTEADKEGAWSSRNVTSLPQVFGWSGGIPTLAPELLATVGMTDTQSCACSITAKYI